VNRFLKCGLFLAAVVATYLASAQVHQIPVRPVRQMLAAQHIPLYTIPIPVTQTNLRTSAQRSASTTQQCVFTLTPSSISVPWTGGSGVIIVTARPRTQASLIIEPLTNGIVSIIVTNAEPAEAWTVQRSADLVTWLGGITLRNSNYYQWAEYFPTNSDHLFIRLSAP
jgi:hypothetical protein